ncbi:calmodulin-binding transcription activator 3-like isoform X1 [Oryza brachyantha]|uniref:calmodulin-binding transcription activator 3-like isoform X1 n=1 Tax=Oryza brachyantha TaxID=4533 RepID=UPI001ADD5009|nr:calmodulin-binding transcription activator 3-like isoform X1 [Oryza brachyantha]
MAAADARRLAVVPQLDIAQILKEAQQRWLRPAEICEILKNYRSFRIAPEPPNRPQSGSLFLFDRKVLRYFRKDGHNWRKKKDGKTVKEAHERLKSGSIDVLHCYYAHGEENENFQRRTYWMLEEDFMHIVLVHYLETKGGKSRTRGHNDMLQAAAMDSPLSQLPSQTIEGESSVSGQFSEYEEAESADIYSGGAGYNSFTQMQHQQNGIGPVIDASMFSSHVPASSIGNYQGQHAMGDTASFFSSTQHDSPLVFRDPNLEHATNGNELSWNGVMKPDEGAVQMSHLQNTVQPEQFTQGPGVEYLTFDEVYSDGLSLKDIGAAGADVEPFWQFSGATGDISATQNSIQQNDGSLEAAIGYPFLKTQSSNLSDILKDSFKKSDSFTRWMSKELLEVEDSQIQSSSGAYWNTEEADSIIEASSREPLDQFTVAPMVLQDQLFTIVDFLPSWTYAGSKTKVLVTGRFLHANQVTERHKWSCMFGEVEIPADISADGSLRCYSPPHKPGRVPFYVTCSNRLACSEVREFEFRPSDSQYMDAPSPLGATNKVYFQIRLDNLLSLEPHDYQATITNPSKEMIDLSKKISSLLANNDEWSKLLKLADDNELLTDDQQDQYAEKLIKEKLHVWLLHKVGDGGKGPSVLDDEGLGVLHLAAALGYGWAIRPTVTAGVNINFRDFHGWTALHWAAFCGRERTVVALIALGAAPGALTDPHPNYPAESTPADLASANGHKGISGFLAESSLTSHLQALNLKEANMSEISGLPGIVDITERSASQPAIGDSLGAVRNAAQAAALIYQVFRVQSFQRKQAIQYEGDKGGISDEHALSLVSMKASKPGQLDPLNAAASRIQNKYRGWKGRKEFLLIRQRIVKIQAHVRGHQVRKHYRKIVWSVGIVEKVILRWRRRRAGLRGFRPTEGAIESSSGGTSSSLVADKPAGDDYDFLQEGRKQTEERLQKALARVKSMVQYPEARDQYQRILNVVSKMQESQIVQEKILDDSAEMDEGNFMSEFKELWDDDTPLPDYF